MNDTPSTEKKTEAVSAPAPVVAIKASSLPALAILLSLVALGVAGSQPWWVGKLQPAPVNVAAALEDLKARVASIPAPTDTTALQERLEQLEARLVAPARDTRTAEQIEALQVNQEQLIERLSEIDQLKTTISQLEKQLGNGAQQNTAEKTLLAASLQLTAAWQNSKPFDAPWLAVLASASATDADLAAQLNDMAPSILPWRDRGIPTLAKLTTDFAPVARTAIAQSLPEGASWWQRTQQQVGSLVTVRRQGTVLPAEDMALDAVLGRAEAALAQGQLAAAVEEVEKLEDPAQALQDWLAGARAFLAAQALGTLLSEKAAGYISTSTTTSGEGALP